MIITIDGPAASGKSTVAQLLAQRLNYYYLNSGLLYRACAYILLNNGFTLEQLAVLQKGILAEFLKTICFNYCYLDNTVYIIYKEQDITVQLKSASIDKAASVVSAFKEVREALLAYQRSFAQKNSLVTDGRDCGTLVFPHADYKFFLTASLAIRAERWQKDQTRKGTNISLEESKIFIEERDMRDTTRSLAPLIAAPDAYTIDNSRLNQEQTVMLLLEYIKD